MTVYAFTKPQTATPANQIKSVVPDSQQLAKPKEKVILLDGPLSEVYTQALNIVYSKLLSL